MLLVNSRCRVEGADLAIVTVVPALNDAKGTADHHDVEAPAAADLQIDAENALHLSMKLLGS